jgi:hypothetical protein
LFTFFIFKIYITQYIPYISKICFLFFTEADIRSAVSPVDLTNSSSASESDETSDDDSVKYDTIKLAGRRRTVVPNTTTGHNNTCVSSSNNSVPPAADLLQLAPSLHHTAVDESAATVRNSSSNSPPAVSRLSPSAVRRSASPGAAVGASSCGVTAVSPTTKSLETGTNIIFIFFIYQWLCCLFVTADTVQFS